MPDTSPHSNIRLEEVTTRNQTASPVVAGFASAMPALAETWRLLQDALNDVPALVAEATRLSAALRHARLDRANLAAAARAALAACRDGEPDPLSALRDELNAQGFGDRRGPA